ncbi:gamma-glutamylcyclotransferase [soil metagenome]
MPRTPSVVSAIVPLYAAYGSNMDPAQMRNRCPHSPFAGTGWLADWRITFGGEDLGWEGSLATVVEEPQSAVFVALYDITPADQIALDKWESADTGLYRTSRLRVSTLEGDVVAWTYVLNSYEGGLPSARYLGLIAEAAETAGAPADYVAELRNRPCRSNG